MLRLWAIPRAVATLATVVAIVATLVVAAPINPWNFFGYFTIQSNVLIAATLAVSAAGVARGRAVVPLLRGTATSYIALTGIVYNTLLTGLAAGIAVPWANTVLHAAVPAYAVLDWILAPDRPALPWRRIWVVAPYPLVWLAVVLVRGATDGWVPYPFLDPATGYGPVALSCLLITVTVFAIAALVWLTSRLGGRRAGARLSRTAERSAAP